MQKGEMYVGWSAKEDVRKRGGSGGLVTSMLAAALEKKLGPSPLKPEGVA